MSQQDIAAVTSFFWLQNGVWKSVCGGVSRFYAIYRSLPGLANRLP